MTGDETFQREALEVLRSGQPSQGDNLLGMEMDFNAYLGSLNELAESSLSIVMTTDHRALILVDCSPASGFSVGEAAEAVRRVWLGQLRYNFFEAHHLAVADDEAVLRLVTEMGPAGLYVTARVDIRRG